MKKIKIIGKQAASGYKVPADNHTKRRLFLGASLRKYSGHHTLLRSNVTEAHTPDTYSGVQKTSVFKSGGKADRGFSVAKLQQPFPYTYSAPTPAPWHGPPPGWQREELPPPPKPSSKFVVVCIGTESEVQSCR